MSIWDKFGHWADEALGFQGKRQASRLANEQIKAYKEQTAITNQQLSEAREAKAAEKRRIDEKQIRRLRHNFRPAGFLDNSSGSAVTNKLGG